MVDRRHDQFSLKTTIHHIMMMMVVMGPPLNACCRRFMPHGIQELAEEFGRHRAREFNVGVERRDTGVRFEDVAGIDDVKADIEEVMKMILGDAEYRAMGARAPRVCAVRTALGILCSLGAIGAQGVLWRWQLCSSLCTKKACSLLLALRQSPCWCSAG